MSETATATPHLWDVKHEYRCTEGLEERFASWADFMKEWAIGDMDLNLVFRWDWIDMTDEDYWPDCQQPAHGKDELRLFVIQQRTGRFVSLVVLVDQDEEPQIAEWLRPRWEHLQALWQPLSS